MRLHETWTGAANPGDRTFSVASVEGVSFTVSKTGEGGCRNRQPMLFSYNSIGPKHVCPLNIYNFFRHTPLDATLSFCHQALKGFKLFPVCAMTTFKSLAWTALSIQEELQQRMQTKLSFLSQRH